MPEISRFLGVVIGMFYNEHGVAHFHAVYGEHEISVEVESGEVHGSFPKRALQRIAPLEEAMDYHVVEAEYVGGYSLRLRFRDGTVGEIDLAPALRGPIFEPLRDKTYFQAFTVHPEFHTLVWPNGADFAPEYLHDNVRVAAR